MRYTVEPATFTVVDTATGIRITCPSFTAMYTLCRDLELEASHPQPARSDRKEQVREMKRQAGVK